MTEVAAETGTPVATPPPVPSPAPSTPAPANRDAQRASDIRAALDKAQASTGKPASGATQEPSKEAPAEVPTFFAKKAEAPETQTFDPAKLPTELQPFYKSMQGDYTRKTQELAELRKQIESERGTLAEERKQSMDSFKSLIETLKGTSAQPQPGSQDPMAQIQALRDEGRHAEADTLMLQVAQKYAEAQNEPLKKEAQLNLLRTTFRDTTSEIMSQNPIVQRYKDDVVKVFDGNTPVMNTLRPYLLQNEQSIRTFVPLVLNAIATELHAKALEENYQKAVETGIKSGLEARRGAAERVPSRLVESGGASRESPPGKMTLQEATRLAVEQTRPAS